MTKICSNCKTDNPDNSKFCQSCGADLKEVNNPVESNTKNVSGIGGFWNKQSRNGKIALGVGVCCLGLIIIIAIGGMMAPDSNTNTSTTTTNTSTPATTTSTPATTTSTSAAPTQTTISALMGSSVPVGTNVEVSGTVLQSGDGFLIIEDDNYNDLHIDLDSSNTKTAYENQKVTVIGTTAGPYDYTTVTGADRNIPGIENGIIQ